MTEYLSALGQQFTSMRWTDAVDIILVVFLIYKFLPLLRSTGAMRMAGVIVAVVLLSLLTQALRLYTLNYLISQFMGIGLLAVVILFQPELRRMLDHLGKMKVKNLFSTQKPEEEMLDVIAHTVRACENMSQERVGALIVFGRDNPLDEYFKTGTMIDAKVSAPLMRNLFFPKAALHDGAVIINEGRVVAAGCVLPLSESSRLNVDLGTRHRAAVGMREVSDAVVVVVSEETGAISVAVGGMLKRHLAGQTLEKLLINELCPQVSENSKNFAFMLKQKLQMKDKEADGNDKE